MQTHIHTVHDAVSQIQMFPPAVQKDIFGYVERWSEKLQTSNQQSNHINQQPTKKRQLGFMKGEINVPDDINWGDDAVLAEFGEEA